MRANHAMWSSQCLKMGKTNGSGNDPFSTNGRYSKIIPLQDALRFQNFVHKNESNGF